MALCDLPPSDGRGAHSENGWDIDRVDAVIAITVSRKPKKMRTALRTPPYFGAFRPNCLVFYGEASGVGANCRPYGRNECEAKSPGPRGAPRNTTIVLNTTSMHQLAPLCNFRRNGFAGAPSAVSW